MKEKEISELNNLIIKFLKADNSVEFGKLFGPKGRPELLQDFLCRPIVYKSSKDDDERPVNGKDVYGMSNTVLCGVYVYKSYKCFAELALFANDYMDFEVLLRKILLVKGDNLHGILGMRNNNFMELIAGKTWEDILPWIVGPVSEYWIEFLCRKGSGENEYRKAMGVLNILKGTTVQGSDLVLALYKAKIINFADVLFIVEQTKNNISEGTINVNTMMHVEHEELLRANNGKLKQMSVVAL